jgi:hypothetical protein
VQSGTIRDCSVGFWPLDWRSEGEDGEQHEVFTRCDLDEVSLVLRGAVPGAEVLASRGLRDSIPDREAIRIMQLLERKEITLAEAERMVRGARGLLPFSDLLPDDEDDDEDSDDKEDAELAGQRVAELATAALRRHRASLRRR